MQILKPTQTNSSYKTFKGRLESCMNIHFSCNVRGKWNPTSHIHFKTQIRIRACTLYIKAGH